MTVVQVKLHACVAVMEPAKPLSQVEDAYLTARQECMAIWFEGYVKMPNANLLAKQYGQEVAYAKQVKLETDAEMAYNKAGGAHQSKAKPEPCKRPAAGPTSDAASSSGDKGKGKGKKGGKSKGKK